MTHVTCETYETECIFAHEKGLALRGGGADGALPVQSQDVLADGRESGGRFGGQGTIAV